MSDKRLIAVLCAACLCMFDRTVLANKLTVTNFSLQAGGFSDYTYVQAEISWNNSWKASWAEGSETVTNWDAAWIFVKYRYQGGDWQHASLSMTNSEHIVPAGATINVGPSTDVGGTNFGAGVFLYRSNEGRGSWTNIIKLRWNYAQDGVSTNSRVDISVHGVEMVYVPQGSFYVGDGSVAAIRGQFEEGAGGTPFPVTNDSYVITLGGGGVGSLGNNNTNGMNVGDDFNDTVSTGLPAAFPKGYNAFYCMKYEISHGQYAEFLNMLTPVQAAARFPTNNGINRFTITSNANVYVAGAPERAGNYLSWADGAAYFDWAGLRPMTELEFEKACRGAAMPLAGEYAWGNTTLSGITNFAGIDSSGTETADPSTANCNYNNAGILGPVRCGIFATAVSGRVAAGGSYWGIMEMSGNVGERAVTVGNATGRLFTGAMGDGRLDAAGNADVGLWPGTGGIGGSWRGGNWYVSMVNLRISDRTYAARASGSRIMDYGWRGIRTAP